MKNPKAIAKPSFHVRSILVPIDFSTPSKQALKVAASLATQLHSQVTVIHVIEPLATPDFAVSFPLAMDQKQTETVVKRELGSAVKAAGIPKEIVDEIIVSYGRSFHEIVETARIRKIDLIIIPSHGYTGIKHLVMGSTAERVVRHAPCPVLVVKDPPETAK